MRRLAAIGEALIDFIPGSTEGEYFSHIGGAPANVCAAYAKLSEMPGCARLITQLGNDIFGRRIQRGLESFGVDCGQIRFTDEAPTSLAFVVAGEDGERDYFFVRNPGADMLLSADAVKREALEGVFALHFCSVSLGDFPMRDAHRMAIRLAAECGAVISFDVNLRPALWKRTEDMLAAVKAFLPLADIVKLTLDEALLITDCTREEDVARVLFSNEDTANSLIVITNGAEGATAYTKKLSCRVSSVKTAAADTTGAGDAFIGAFLFALERTNIGPKDISLLSYETLEEALTFASRCAAISVSRSGAAESYPGYTEIN